MSASNALRAGFVALAAGGVLAIVASASCVNAPDKNRVTTVLEPDFRIYHDNVDAYLARRCGTLDCHGQPGRAYRIYSREGFRLYNDDAGLVSGQQPTTEDEILANFEAIVGLEPEEMSRVIAAQGADDALMRWIWIRKPLKLERHKGGTVMALDDTGYECVQAWLRVPVVDGNGVPIPAASRIDLTATQKGFCSDATSNP